MILPLKTPFIGDSHFRTEKPILSCPFRRIHSGFMAVDESIDVLRVRVMKMGMQWGYNQLFPTIYIYIIGIYIYIQYIYIYTMIWVCFNLRQETSASDQANPWATGRSCSNGDREALGACTWNRASVNGHSQR